MMVQVIGVKTTASTFDQTTANQILKLNFNAYGFDKTAKFTVPTVPTKCTASGSSYLAGVTAAALASLTLY